MSPRATFGAIGAGWRDSARGRSLSVLLLEPSDDRAVPVTAALRAGVGPAVEITRARTLAEAEELMGSGRPTCALVDLSGSDPHNLEAVRALIERDPLLSIIVLTAGVADRDRGVEAVRAGAQDYVSRADLTPQVLGRIVRYAVERADFHRRLGASEQVLARAMEHSPIGWSLVSPEGAYLDVNPAFATLVGRTAGELIGTHLNACTHPEDRSDASRALGELHAGIRSDFQGEKRYVRPDGEVVWALINVTAVRDHRGERIEYFLVQAQDITHKREARASRARLAALVDGSSDAIYSMDLEGTITSWNPGAERFFGYPSVEALGMPVSTLVPPDLGHELSEYLNRARGGQGTGPYETFRKRQDGSLVRVSLVISPIIDHRGQPVGASAIARDISEQERARVELQRSEERYRSLIEAVHEGIWAFDHDGQTTLVNHHMGELLGYSLDELQQRSLWDFLDPGEDLGAIAGNGNAPPREVRLRRKDGDAVWVLLSAATLRDSHGAALGSIVSVSDITASKRSEVMFRRLVEHAPDAMVIVNQSGEIVLVNTQAERMFGRRRDELVGQRADLLLPERLRDEYRAHGARYLERPEFRMLTRAHDLHGQRRDGGEFPVEILLSPLETETETLVASSIRDISERLEQERELEQRERRFRAVFDHAEDAMLIVDDERRYRHANPAAARLFGRSVDELLSLRVDDLAAAELRSSAPQTFAAFKRAGQINGEYVVTRPDGEERNVEYAATADILPGRHLTILHDVTERTRAEHERAALEAQLHQAQRLESVGKLAGGVAHDFNNLLSIILNYSHYAKAKSHDPELRDELCEVIRAAERAASLTRQLLIFSRADVARPEVIDLCGAVEQAVGLMKRTLGERIAVETDLPEDPMPILLDSGQLDQVLLNLAVNARDAMPDGGVLRFSVSVDPAGGAAGPLAEQWIRLTVSDTGEGMSRDVLARAFDPFFSTKPRDAGTGLGLATVYGIVTQAGGNIALSSEYGAGTMVEIMWPRAAGQTAERDAVDERDDPVAGDHLALVVEDEPSLRKLMERILADHGYHVIAAAGAEEALASPRCLDADLLVTDVVMPGIQGPQLAEILREERPGLPVLFVSGYTDQAAELPGYGQVLDKPFTARELLGAVAQALAAREQEPVA